MANISSLAPKNFPELHKVAGLFIASSACGLKKPGSKDLLICIMDAGTNVATLVTNSHTSAASIVWAKKIRKFGKARAIIANSGNANAFTGRIGEKHVAMVVEKVSKELKCNINEVYMASTGVIGEVLDCDKILGSIPNLINKALNSNFQWVEAAQSLMTTDTFPKGASATANINGKRVVISGIAKGSGMIAPNMATMLAFIFTDASIPIDILNLLIREISFKSFNSITVDGDTSTNDIFSIFATNKVKLENPLNGINDEALIDFKRALSQVAIDLAKQIVIDGEGATKLIEIIVKGTSKDIFAHQIAMSIANSPLFKTAIAGEDANWGRIVMAIGKAGIPINQNEVSIKIGGLNVASAGAIDVAYNEKLLSNYMKEEEVSIEVFVGVGNGNAKIWTCDLTHGYISINADYRS